MTDPILARVGAGLDRLSHAPHRLGIALSGGGDSVALMHLAALWAGSRGDGTVLKAATVDHALRAGSRAEAEGAGRAAAALGIPHSILHWHQEPNEGGNLMARARDARLRLIGDWARAEGLDAVLLGHTLDDQAETFLMRLGRGAGVDGLAGMAARREAEGMIWLRPMLEVGRAELRDWLCARGIAWVDDPSNENPDFVRVRMRKALADLGIPLASFAQTLGNLQMAQDALQQAADQIAARAEARNGSLALPLDDLRAAPEEIRRRLLVAALRWISGADYAPRREKIAHALAEIAAGRKCTLEGALIEPRGGQLWLMREPEAAFRATPGIAGADGSAQWDGRWQVTGMAPDQQLRALGYAALSGFDWRASGIPRDALAASPGLFAAERLIAAPLLEKTPGVTIHPLRALGQFRRLLFSH